MWEELIKSSKIFRVKHMEGINAKLTFWGGIVAILSGIFGLVNVVSMQYEKTPRFTLAYDELDYGNQQITIKDSNDTVSNMSLEDAMMNIELVIQEENSTYQVPYRIDIKDAYTKDSGYKSKENAVVINDASFVSTLAFIKYFEDTVRCDNISIVGYSIKEYFTIVYDDYKGREKTKIFMPENNYTYLPYDFSDFQRYLTDNRLIEINKKDIPDSLMEVYCWEKGNFTCGITNLRNGENSPTLDQMTDIYKDIDIFRNTILSQYLYITTMPGFDPINKNEDIYYDVRSLNLLPNMIKCKDESRP